MKNKKSENELFNQLKTSHSLLDVICLDGCTIADDEILTLRQERDFDIGSPFLIFNLGFSETNIFSIRRYSR